MTGLRVEDRDKPTQLYFLVMCGRRRYLKVGVAPSLKRRMRDYKNYMPMERVRLIHSVELPHRFAARQWEATILAWFREKRVNRSEWIEIDAEVRDFLKRLRSGDGGVELMVYEGAARNATRPCDKIYRENLLRAVARLRAEQEARAA